MRSAEDAPPPRGFAPRPRPGAGDLPLLEVVVAASSPGELPASPPLMLIGLLFVRARGVLMADWLRPHGFIPACTLGGNSTLPSRVLGGEGGENVGGGELVASRKPMPGRGTPRGEPLPRFSAGSDELVASGEVSRVLMGCRDASFSTSLVSRSTIRVSACSGIPRSSADWRARCASPSAFCIIL